MFSFRPESTLSSCWTPLVVGLCWAQHGPDRSTTPRTSRLLHIYQWNSPSLITLGIGHTNCFGSLGPKPLHMDRFGPLGPSPYIVYTYKTFFFLASSGVHLNPWAECGTLHDPNNPILSSPHNFKVSQICFQFFLVILSFIN